MTEPIKLADRVDDVRYDTTVDCLTRVLDRVQNGYKSDPDFHATGVLVVLVDQTGGRYYVKRECSSLKTSELIALLQVALHQELKQLEPAAGE